METWRLLWKSLWRSLQIVRTPQETFWNFLWKPLCKSLWRSLWKPLWRALWASCPYCNYCQIFSPIVLRGVGSIPTLVRNTTLYASHLSSVALPSKHNIILWKQQRVSVNPPKFSAKLQKFYRDTRTFKDIYQNVHRISRNSTNLRSAFVFQEFQTAAQYGLHEVSIVIHMLASQKQIKVGDCYGLAILFYSGIRGFSSTCQIYSIYYEI